jgi:hypothetical protein
MQGDDIMQGGDIMQVFAGLLSQLSQQRSTGTSRAALGGEQSVPRLAA